MKTLAAIALLISIQCNADSSVIAGGWSYHLDSWDGYNETHNAFIVKHDHLVIGTFKNSYSDRSWLAGYDFSSEYHGFTFGVVAGVVTGYQKYQLPSYMRNISTNSVTPAIIPYVELSSGRVTPVAMMIGNAITVAIDVKF